jgi:iron complex outermembrane recepter protein
MKKTFLMASAATVILSSPVMLQPAFAQSEEAPTPTENAGASEVPDNGDADIIVTGSLIRGTAKNTALPVSVIDAEDIAKRGSPTMLDLIKTLPVAGPVFGEVNQFNSSSARQTGAGSVNLRGLGPQRTLILLNGRRVVSAPGLNSGGPNTELFPVSAIGRVEVLKDGAAATYGSDAVAGVVNFITRKNFSGLDLSAGYQAIPGSKGDYTASGVFGWVGEGVNILLSAGYQHRSKLSTLKRDYAVLDYFTNPAGFSTTSNPGTYRIRNGTTNLGGPVLDANCEQLGGYLTFTATTPNCAYGFAPFYNLVETTNKYQLYGEINFEVTDRIDFHMEALYGKNSIPNIETGPSFTLVNGPNGPGGTGQFVIPSSNPGFIPFLQQTGNAARIGTATNIIGVAYRPIGLGATPGVTSKANARVTDLYRLSSSLSGSITDSIDFDIAGTYSESSVYQLAPDILITRYQAALNGLGGPACTGTTPGANGCLYFNPFSNGAPGNPVLGLTNPGYVSSAANNPAVIDWMFDPVRGRRESQKLFVIDAVLSGKLGLGLPGGDVGWAVGGQYRRGHYAISSTNGLGDSTVTPCPDPSTKTCAFPTGPYVFLGQATPVRLDEEIKAVFGELSVPLFDAFNLQFAARYEDYGGLTGSTFNPKVAAKWQIAEPIAIRGSYSTTFKGPAMVERALSGTTQQAAINAAGGQFKAIDSFGSPSVGPERAKSYNIGAIFTPSRRLTITADYWHYRLRDQILPVPANVIASAVAGNGNGSQLVNCASPLRPLITFDNNDICTQGVTIGNNISRIRSDTANGAPVTTSGIDFELTYQAPEIAGVEATLGASFSRTLKYDQEAFFYAGNLVSGAYDALGFTNYNRSPGTIPKLRGQAYIDLSAKNHNLRFTFNYIGGATDNRGPAVLQTASVVGGCTVANAPTTAGCVLNSFGLRVKPFYTFDSTYRVELPWDMAVTASVYNIFNRDPSSARLELGYDSFIGNPIGRSFKIGVTKHF